MIIGKNIVLFVGLFIGLFLVGNLYAQKTKTQLKRERYKNIKKIKETEYILKETKARKKNSLGALNALNQRISQQELLIQSMQNELNLINMDINENTQIIVALENDLSSLKKEYIRMLHSAQKTSGKLGQLMFLFSAESFNQFLLRMKYIEQYSLARKNQAHVIKRVQQILLDQIQQTQIIKTEKNDLLNKHIEESNNLISFRKVQNNLIKKLEHEENRFKIHLKKTQKSIALLDQLINDIIRKEMMLATKKKKSKKELKNLSLSSNFVKNKHKFLWPVSGFISQRFGKQKHPILKNIEIYNEGINIQTRKNEIVKTIFEGEIRAIALIPSIGHSIIIGHGEYFTVYSGLDKVLVKQGQHVTTHQKIGYAFTNVNGTSELRFQIRKNTVAVDPEQWLKK